MADDPHNQFSEHEAELIEKGLARVYRGRLIPIIQGGEPDDDEGQEPDNEPGTEPDTDPDEDEGREPKSYDEDYVKKLRREAAAARKARQEAERKLKEKEDAELSEAERAKKRADEAEAARDEALQKAERKLKRAAVIAEAATAGFHDPSDAFMRIEDEIELDDDGEPTNVADLVKQLAEDRPYLLKSAGDSDGESKRKASPANPQQRKMKSGLTLEKVKQMSPREIAALPAEQQEEINRLLAA